MTVLQNIVAEVRRDLESRMSRCSRAAIEAQALTRSSARDFHAALSGAGVSLIAEVKKASPSRGIIRTDLDAVEVATIYAAAGADAISVLTEERHFGGSLGDLSRVDELLGPDGPPLLRKDFIVDPYQVYEGRACGADCVLLIAALLSRPDLAHLARLCRQLGMASIVEVHDEADLDKALECESRIIGINNRNLHTFEVDLETFSRLRPLVPAGILVVAESGVRKRRDVELLARVGADAVLVGEAIMSAPDIEARIRELRCETSS